MPGERCFPLARLIVWDKGAEGYSTDPGWAWHSAFASESTAWTDDGAYPFDCGAGTPMVPAFEYIVCGPYCLAIPTPIIYPWHTEIDQWTETVGVWEEHTLPVGGAGDGVTVLWNKEQAGRLDSDFFLPEAPNFCARFQVYAPDKDYDALTDPPYISVFWGPLVPAGDEVAYEVHIQHDGEMYIGEHYAGGVSVRTPLGNIGWQWPTEGERWNALSLTIMHLAGGIAIRPSSGGGQWWWYQGDGNIWPDAGGQLTLECQGGRSVVALHGVVGPEPTIGSGSTTNTLTSAVRETDRTRAGRPTTYGYYWIGPVAAPTVAPAITLGDNDHSGTDDVELYAEVTWGYKPAEDGLGVAIPAQVGFPLSYRFCYFPELYAVGTYFIPVVAAPALYAPYYTEYYSDMIGRIRVFQNDEEDASHADVVVRWDSGDLGNFVDNLYMQYVTLDIGWRYDDYPVTPDSLTTMISGYVTETKPADLDPKRVGVRHTIVGPSTRLRQIECDDTWLALDTANAQAALEHCAAKCGVHVSLTNFASCAAFTLSEGRPEEPLWYAQAGELAWEFMERIARYCGQEMVVAAGGGIATRPIFFVDVLTAHNLASTDCSMARAHRRQAFSYTGVEVHGRMADGTPLVSWIADTAAESNPAYIYYRGFRRLERIEEAGLVTQLDCDALAVICYNTQPYRIADLFAVETVGYETAIRRDVMFVAGLHMGITGAHRLAIVGLEHNWGPRKPDCKTTWYAVYYPT